MKFLVALSALLAVALAEDSIVTLQEYYQQNPHDPAAVRIIDGYPANVAQFPFQVAVTYTTPNGNFFCGGVLINNQWILTAAHCTINAISFTLYIGGVTLNASENGRLVEISSVFVRHENYDSSNLNNDIALIHLPEPILFSDRVQPIRLPQQHEITLAQTPVTVSGWGRTSDASNSISSILNYVDLVTISNPECAQVYGNYVIIGSTICARGNPHHSVCNGDSGGPLIVYDADGVPTVIGIVSFVNSLGCASGNPSGYVRTESFLDWINHHAAIPV